MNLPHPRLIFFSAAACRTMVVVVVCAAASTLLQASQQSSPTPIRLLNASAGIGGRVVDGRFVLAEERTSFSREHDKELFVSFMWEGTPGTHRLVATWRGPDGTVSSAAPIEYQAKEPRFGAFWQLPVSPTMAIGPWSVDITVNGQPGGRLTFDIKAEAVPVVATKRLLTQAQLFETLNNIHVIVQRTTSVGRALEPAAAMAGSDGRLYTAVTVLDEADRLHAHVSSGESRPVDALVAWSRPGHWAVLSGGGISAPPQPVLANQNDVKVGDRCFAMDGSTAGARVLLDGVVTGRTGGPRPAWIVTFQTGFARAGSPVLNESGELLGIVNRPTDMFESLKAQQSMRGTALLEPALFSVANPAPAVALADLRARGELLGPVLGEAHVVSGGFAASINRGPIVAPADQRAEFATSEKGFTVFVTWSPQERLRGMMSMKLYTADNRMLSQSAPKKSDLKKQNLVLTSWQIAMLKTAGVYRADVLMDDKIMWRGYVRLTQ